MKGLLDEAGAHKMLILILAKQRRSESHVLFTQECLKICCTGISNFLP